MAHIRKTIRDNLKTALTGLTTTGNNISASRVYAIRTLPAIILYTLTEESSYATIGLPRTVERVLNVVAEIYVKGSSGYDDQIDQISLEIEEAIYADVTLGGIAKDTRLTGLDVQFRGDGDQPVGIGVVTIQVTYHTTEGSPQ